MKTGLTPDREPWVPIAKRVLAGEFDSAYLSVNESLRIGLRSVDHPDCQKAHAHLETLKDSAAKLSQRLFRHVT